MKCYRCGEETFASVEAKFAKQEARIAELEKALAFVDVIKNATDHERALAEVSRLMTADPAEGSAEAKRLAVLAVLVEDYERRRIPIAPPTETELQEALALAQAEAQKATEELLEQSEELTETHELVDQLRGELRRYEPSDGIMYTLLEKRCVINDAAALLERVDSWGNGSTTFPGVLLEEIRAWRDRHRNDWSKNLPRPIPEPERTILALHTVIDEGRRLMDRAWDEDNAVSTWDDWTGLKQRGITPDTWAAIDEWRQRVLVQAARETVSGEVAKMIAVINNCDELDARRVQHIKGLEAERTALIESCKRLAERQYHCPKCETVAPDALAQAHAALVDSNCRLAIQNAELHGQLGAGQYGLALDVEREKVKLLVGAVKDAAALMTASFQETEGGDEFGQWRERKKAWLANPTVTAAVREAEG